MCMCLTIYSIHVSIILCGYGNDSNTSEFYTIDKGNWIAAKRFGIIIKKSIVEEKDQCQIEQNKFCCQLLVNICLHLNIFVSFGEYLQFFWRSISLKVRISFIKASLHTPYIQTIKWQLKCKTNLIVSLSITLYQYSVCKNEQQGAFHRM